MKTIEVDDELYQYIASQTQHIGESASSILRRLLDINTLNSTSLGVAQNNSADPAPITDLFKSEAFLNEKKLVNRFLLTLSVLYHCNQSLFSVATTSLHGSKRRYLAKDELTLIQSGNNTKPKQIPDSPYWVVTNSNTARKIYIIESIMRNMQLSDQLIAQFKEMFVVTEAN